MRTDMADKHESELDKARGATEGQEKLRAYHEGKFQSHDPVTGEKRGKLARHAEAEAQGGPLGDPEPAESAESVRARRAAAKSSAVAPMSTDSVPLVRKSKSAKRK
jgi:hypothetical protein